MAQGTVKEECGMSRAKSSEPIEMTFEMVSGVGARNRVLHGRSRWCHLENTVGRLCAATEWVTEYANRDGDAASSQITSGNFVFILCCSTVLRMRMFVFIVFSLVSQQLILAGKSISDDIH